MKREECGVPQGCPPCPLHFTFQTQSTRLVVYVEFLERGVDCVRASCRKYEPKPEPYSLKGLVP